MSRAATQGYNLQAFLPTGLFLLGTIPLIHDGALGFSPVTSYSGVKDGTPYTRIPEFIILFIASPKHEHSGK